MTPTTAALIDSEIDHVAERAARLAFDLYGSGALDVHVIRSARTQTLVDLYCEDPESLKVFLGEIDRRIGAIIEKRIVATTN